VIDPPDVSESDTPPSLATPRGALAERRVIAARNAVAVAFALHGLAIATWLSRVPATRDALGLSVGQLRLLMLALSGSCVLALPTGGAVTHRLCAARTMVAATGGRADPGGVAGVAEVAVAVQERQPVAATPAKRQRRTQQDAAVPAQHQRERTRVQQPAQPVGQPAGVGGQRGRVEHPAALLPGAPVIAGRHQVAGVPRVQPAQQPLIAQGAGELVAAGHNPWSRRAQPKVGRGIQHHHPTRSVWCPDPYAASPLRLVARPLQPTQHATTPARSPRRPCSWQDTIR
jgi:hypothetical protein